jgi:outer membrane protein insertion porin family
MNKRWIWVTLLAVLGSAWVARAAPIRDIRVTPVGEVPISAEQVLAQVSVQVGQELDRMAMSEDIRSLQRSGAYSYAEVRVEQDADGGIILNFRVSGRPKIRSLKVSGAEALGNKKVRNLMEIGSGDRVDNALLGQKAQKVRDSYRKDYFPEASVEWTFTPVPGRPEFTDVEIQVTEGRRAVVRRILFKGNKSVSRGELLAVMTQKQSSWLSWMNSAGVYEPGSLLPDREALRRVFMDHGFLGASVSEPTFAYVSKKKIDITFEISEGPVYTIANWNIGGMTLFDPAAVSRGIMIRAGEEASLSAVDRTARNIRDFYGARGYIQTDVEPLISLNTNLAQATVDYQVEEGTLAYIQNVEIRGNSQTQDKVIRREISVLPGQIYNEVKVRSSENRVRNLNYFSFVNSFSENTAVSNRFNLIFDVEEQRTGQFMVGAGISSVDNIVGFVELTQGNFDLFGWPRFTGGGQKLRLRVQAGSERTDVELSWIEPWFLNRRLSLGIDLFQHDAQFLSDDYDQINTGGSVTLGKPLFSFNRINWIYGLENIDIKNVATNASDLIKAEGGGALKSYATMEVIRDTRNNTFIPSRGFRGSAAATLAGGPLGGDTDTYQFQLRGSQYFSLWFEHVLNFRGWTSIVEEYGNSDHVPIFDRLFLGGPRTVRGFKFREVGPKDDTEEPIGGRSAFYGTVEYTIPIVDSVRFAVFYDIGTVWLDLFKKDEDVESVGDGVLNDDYGIGVRFDFPQFPIQLDYAWPINTDEVNSDSGRFSFSIGYTY